ncbi:MAG: FtsX-like permease family protein [Cyclobacteriaceae bacterium]
MNLPYFISKRISKNEHGSFSSTINRIAVISIAVALASLIVAFMVLGGFEKVIKDKIFSFGGHLDITKYSLSTSFEDNVIDVADSLVDGLKKYEEIDRVVPYAYKAGLLKTDEEVQGVIVKGVGDTFDSNTFSRNIIAGNFPEFVEDGYSTEVLISAKIANYLTLSVGDEIVLFFVQNPPRARKVVVSGIYETGLEDFDEKIILADLKLLARINNWKTGQAGGLEIYLKKDTDMDRMEEELFNFLNYDLYIDKASDKYPQTFDWLRMLDRNVIIFFTLILVVACVNMISILLILIMERTQMIGVLKAVGAENALIRKIFIWNGLQLIIKGLFWGNLIGLGFCFLQSQFQLIPLDPTNYYMDTVPILFNYPALLILNVLSVAIVGLTLIVPVAIISRITPVKAIRFD